MFVYKSRGWGWGRRVPQVVAIFFFFIPRGTRDCVWMYKDPLLRTCVCDKRKSRQLKLIKAQQSKGEDEEICTYKSMKVNEGEGDK